MSETRAKVAMVRWVMLAVKAGEASAGVGGRHAAKRAASFCGGSAVISVSSVWRGSMGVTGFDGISCFLVAYEKSICRTERARFHAGAAFGQVVLRAFSML